MAPDAPLIHSGGNMLSHQVLNRGDAYAAIKAAKYVVTRHYSTPQTDHAFMDRNVPLRNRVKTADSTCIRVVKACMMSNAK